MEAGTFNRAAAATRPAEGTGRSGVAVASLIVGILGFVGFFALIAPAIFGPMAILFGVMGRREAAQKGVRGHGMATAGIVLGVLALVAGGIFLALGLS